jgi:hypothetical protein
MKIVKIVFGGLFGLFALAHCIFLPRLIFGDIYMSSIVISNLGGLCIEGAISYALLKSAFKKNKD